MNTWTDDKERELFESQEAIADLLMLYSAEQNECAGLHAINAELLEALEELFNLLEDNQDDAPWYLRKHYNKAEEAIRKASRKGALFSYGKPYDIGG